MKLKSFLTTLLCGVIALAPTTDTFAKDKNHRPSKGGASHKSKGGSKGESSHRMASMHRPSSSHKGPSSNGRPHGGSSSRHKPQPQFARSGPSHGGSHATPRPDSHHRPVPNVVSRHHRTPLSHSFRPYYRPLPYVTPYSYPLSYGVSVADVQRALAERGFYYGFIDGEAGPMTRRAIASFQSEAGLDVTGTINGSLLRALDL